MKYTVVVPVLNEAENLKSLIPILLKEDCEVLVCDNGSTDGSVSVAEELGARVSKGSGLVVDAVLRGIHEASCDDFVVMDADFSHPPSLVPTLASGLSASDIVVASRYVGFGSNGDNLKNRLISKVFNLMTLGLAPKVKDRISGFWAGKRFLKDTKIRRSTKPMLEFMVRSDCQAVSEVPYIFFPRQIGKSKIGRSLSTIFREFYSLILLYVHKYWRILSFLFVGGTGVIVSTSSYWIFTQYLGLQYMWASVPSLWLANFNNFMLNDNLTFRHRGRTKRWIRRYLEFLTIYGSTALLDIFMLWFFTEITGIWYFLSFCLALITATAIRMLVSFKFIWRTGKPIKFAWWRK